MAERICDDAISQRRRYERTEAFLHRPREHFPEGDETTVGRTWRVGRKVGRTIYAQVGPEPSDDDVLIGVMDTPELAAEVVRAHAALTATQGGDHV